MNAEETWMDKRQQLFAEMDRLLGEIHEVAMDFQRMAVENREFVGMCEERRSNPNRPNRLLSYSEKKALRTEK